MNYKFNIHPWAEYNSLNNFLSHKIKIILLLLFLPEKETQKGKIKNPKIKKFKRCENVKSNNRIILKMRKCKIQ